MKAYSCDFSASRICNFIEQLSRSEIDKIVDMERSIRIARENATYIKCYLEGHMYENEEIARECVGIQIENAERILKATREI